MPDHPTTPDPQLDHRIRALLARAVDDAPAPPDLTQLPMLDTETPPPDRRPWWIVGTSLLGAAAAALAIVLVSGRADLTVAPAASAVAGPSTTEPTATATPPVPVVAIPPTALAVADGTDVDLLDELGHTITTIDEPWTIAIPVGDGRVVGQARSGPGSGRWAAADTTPYIWSPDGTVLVLFPVVGERSIVLHDIAVVAGTPWLLYSVDNGDPTPEGQREDLYAVSLDGKATVLDVAQIGAWEAGTHRLHLAANGLIVGESWSEATSSLLVLALPGSPADAWADRLDAAALGLEDSYFDCAETCPSSYTVDDAGTTIVWLERSELVTVPVADGTAGPPVRAVVAGATALRSDVDLLSTAPATAAVSYFQADGAAPAPAVLATADAAVALPGTVATWGPGGLAAPGSTTVTSTVPAGPSTEPTTAPPASNGQDDLEIIAAGPSGVVRIVPGSDLATETLLDVPAAIAFDTDAGVLFQSAQGWLDGRDPTTTAPQLRANDGSIVPWSVVTADADPTSAWWLHDVVEFQGQPWVVYSRQTQGDVEVGPGIFEVLDHLYAVPLAGGTPADLGPIGGWETGTSRVQASPSGALVASLANQTEIAYWTATLPGGTPAPTPETLGIAALSSECWDCPRLFGWTSDGGAVTWLDGTAVVVQPVDGTPPTRIEFGDRLLAANGYVVDLEVAVGADGRMVVGISRTVDGGVPEATSIFVVDAEGRIDELAIAPAAQLIASSP